MATNAPLSTQRPSAGKCQKVRDPTINYCQLFYSSKSNYFQIENLLFNETIIFWIQATTPSGFVAAGGASGADAGVAAGADAGVAAAAAEAAAALLAVLEFNR